MCLCLCSKTRVDLLRQGVCVCVYVKDTSRSTETVCVFMSKTRVDLLRQGVCVCLYVRDTSRSTETGSVCVCLCERHE